MKKLLLLGILVLAGCGVDIGGSWDAKPPTISHGVWRDSYRSRVLAQSDFMLELVAVRDVRKPKNHAPLQDQDIIYEYNPEKILSGVKYRLPVLFEKQLLRSSGQSENRYKVEVELHNLRTLMRRGGFKSGRYGEYEVDLVVSVIVRRPDSAVVLDEIFPVEISKIRRSQVGRGPSSSLDQQRMYQLTEDAVEQISQQVSWKMRRVHKKEMKRLEEALEG